MKDRYFFVKVVYDEMISFVFWKGSKKGNCVWGRVFLFLDFCGFLR